MKAFLEWVRFTMVGMDLSSIEDETLQLMMFESGASRDEFMRYLVYQLLLDTDPDNAKKHDLVKVFVSFGLLDENAAQQFVKGNMSTKLHMATWKRIIESIIPTTTFTAPCNSYDEMISNIFEKIDYFQTAQKKNYLPPELIPKLKDQIELKENSRTIEEIAEDIMKILKKPNGHNDVENISKSEENNLLSDCFQIGNAECMDVVSLKTEIDRYIQISNDNKFSPINNKNSVRKTQEEFLKQTEDLDLIQDGFIESKVEDIHKLMKAEHDLQTLADSLADYTRDRIRTEPDAVYNGNSTV